MKTLGALAERQIKYKLSALPHQETFTLVITYQPKLAEFRIKLSSFIYLDFLYIPATDKVRREGFLAGKSDYCIN